MNTLSPDQLQALLEDPAAVQLIDVRTVAEHRAMHVRGAACFPLHTLDPAAIQAARAAQAQGPVVVLCQSGTRATKAAEQLAAAGIDAAVVEGGTPACAAAGLPVVRGTATMSLERQVRIAAGALVAGGTALGWLLHPVFFVVPAFVGCGLVFSGLSNTCGMGSVLARMPWNASGAPA